jgi:V8-like Glu-specific endopeptidase
MTNYHVLDEKYLKQNNEIKITLNDDKKILIIKLNEKRRIYCNENYDTTIIEIKPNDKIDDFMEIDEDILKDDSNISYNHESIYILHYPNSEKAKVSYAILNTIKDYNISHYCFTDEGSSGSPIINLFNHKIIGIHRESSTHCKINYGTYLKYPINEFINKYKEKNNIKSNDYLKSDNQIKQITNKKNKKPEEKYRKKVEDIHKKVSLIIV